MFKLDRPFENYGHKSKKVTSLRVSGKLFISKMLLENITGLTFQECKFYTVYPSVDNENLIAIKFTEENVNNESFTKPCSIEKSGLSLLLLPYLKTLGVTKVKSKINLIPLNNNEEYKSNMVLLDLTKVIDIFKLKGE